MHAANLSGRRVRIFGPKPKLWLLARTLYSPNPIARTLARTLTLTLGPT